MSAWRITGRVLSGDFAEHFARDGNIAPAEPLESLGVDASLEALRVALRLVLVLREEQHAHGERLPGTQKHARLAQQEIARNRGLDADAVAALAVSGNGAAMREAAESGQGKAKDFVFGTAVQGRNEADSAGFVLEAGVEEVLATRRKAATTHSPLYMESGEEVEEGSFPQPRKL